LSGDNSPDNNQGIYYD